MPVTSVAGEPGGVQAQNGPDLPSAQPSHEPLEAGPCNHPAGGAAEVVIDHFDVSKAAASGNLDKLILSPLALKIGLDLRLGGLPDVDDSLAL
jgi:hypothetical protein